MSLLRELQRRNVIRVATAYVVTAWLIVQVIETIFPAFGFGDEAIRVAVIVLGIGFLPAVIAAWVFEWTPEGVKRDEDVRASGSRFGTRELDRIIVAVLLIGLIYFAVDKFVLAPERAAEREAEVAEQAAEEARKGFYGDRSIAVLPFDNLSSDPEQVYFVDGVAEEILNLLARIRGLRVISRSSSFAFREQNLEIPDIAERLDVAHVLEGSVRRAGNRVRVTAQLIEARTDTHLWSKTYDRELDDVFLIQDEIAADVARNLELTLREPLPHSRKVDPEVLALVQQARQIFEIRDENAGLRMKALLQKALEQDPDFAPAIEWLSYAEFVQYTEGTMPEQEMRQRWLDHRARLLELDPHSTIVDFNDAWSFWEAGDLEQAAEKFLRVLAADLSNSLYLRQIGMFAHDLGKLDVAQRLLEHAVAIDPLCFQCLRTLSQILMNRGNIEGAIEVRERYMTIATGGAADYSMMLMQAGRPEEVAAAWAEAPDSLFDKRVHTAMAEFSQGNVEVAQEAAQQLDDELAAAARVHWTYMVASVHAWLGNKDRAFELLWSLPNDPQSVMSTVRRYHPAWDNLRDDPRWPRFLEYIGRSPERLDAIDFDPWLPE